ncbi:hypothetical protein [Methylobacterium nodulans]|uniref:Uncharacterized protein n=1 Tax=Methylobacterium nodulans (strain LMG 21967 / CNCM I-2342 / ORS 2060) TaxID=460265 RepID=B8INQ7_METNO|nr:hypothetical protein [Methylobacterium nodulans]ACL58423.1 hypothetical protein Mnod_3513 [Methylobacterium nodulans ORS 2060]
MDVNNPFYGVKIGSTVDALGNFYISVLSDERHITTKVAQQKADMTMRGESDLVYTTDMHQASIGMAGSYGVEGVEKLTSAVTAYFGYSSAGIKKQLGVVYEIIHYGGYEFINFNELTPLEMLGSLSAAPKNLAGQVLDRYNDYMGKLDKILEHPYVEATEWSIPQVFDLFRDKNYPPTAPKHVKLKSLARLVADAQKLHREWADAASDFRKNFGEGMVVGVLWGGIGQANMTVVDEAEASAWKYGGASKFSYANTLSSVTVEATYDASGSQDVRKVKVKCEGGYIGACVAEQVTSWVGKLNDKAFEDVAKFAPLGAPPVKITKSLPKAPDFVKPPKVEKDTKQLTKDKAEMAAKLATYDKMKALFEKSHPGQNFEKSINDFLKRATTSKPDTGPITKFKQDVASNRLSTRSLLRT